MKRNFFPLVAVVILTMLFSFQAFCQNKETGGPLKKVSIQIDGAAVPYYAPLYVAKEKGYFKQQGLDVDFYYAAAADIVKNVATGNVEFGFPNADSVIIARSQGIPVKVVNTTYQHGLGAVIFKKSSKIKSLADLKGKKVAVTSFGSPNYIQLQVMLKSVGLSINDVKVEIVGTGAIVNALATDQVDAIAFSMLRTIELRNQGVDAAEIRADKYLPSHGNVLIAGEKLVHENPAVIKGFSIALNRGIQYIIKGHASEAVNLSVDKYIKDYAGDKQLVTNILKTVFIPYLWQSETTKKNGLGAANLDRWNKSIQYMKEYKVIDQTFDVKDLLYTIK